jgi:hypothetical protein
MQPPGSAPLVAIFSFLPLGAFSGIVTLTAFAFKSARFVQGRGNIFNHLVSRGGLLAIT